MQESTDAEELSVLGELVLGILTITGLDHDRISEESFQPLRVIWQIAADAVREQHGLPPSGVAPGGTAQAE